MTLNVSNNPAIFAGLTPTSARWFTPVILFMCLVLPTLVAADVHPYERWAKEFGIDMDVSYDGIRVMESKDGTFEATERRAPGKMYLEVFMGSMTAGVILREDLEKTYILMPSMGFYKEDSLKEGKLQASNGMEFSKIEKVGREDINGHPSTRFETKFKDNEGKGSGTVWITDTGVPIRMDMTYSNRKMDGEQFKMQLKELNLREQDPAYFEVPANLKPMSMSNIGQMMQMGAASQEAATTAPEPAAPADDDLAVRQQACIESAVQAAENKKSAEATKGLGRLMGKVALTASRFSNSKLLNNASREIYYANASASDVASIAANLGITEQDVERCKDPG